MRIDLTVLGDELVVNRQPTEQQAYEDLDLTIQDAFGSAERLLKEYARQRRGEIKTHAGGETGDDRNPISQSF